MRSGGVLFCYSCTAYDLVWFGKPHINSLLSLYAVYIDCFYNGKMANTYTANSQLAALLYCKSLNTLRHYCTLTLTGLTTNPEGAVPHETRSS